MMPLVVKCRHWTSSVLESYHPLFYHKVSSIAATCTTNLLTADSLYWAQWCQCPPSLPPVLSTLLKEMPSAHTGTQSAVLCNKLILAWTLLSVFQSLAPLFTKADTASPPYVLYHCYLHSFKEWYKQCYCQYVKPWVMRKYPHTINSSPCNFIFCSCPILLYSHTHSPRPCQY